MATHDKNSWQVNGRAHITTAAKASQNVSKNKRKPSVHVLTRTIQGLLDSKQTNNSAKVKRIVKIKRVGKHTNNSAKGKHIVKVKRVGKHTRRRSSKPSGKHSVKRVIVSKPRYRITATPPTTAPSANNNRNDSGVKDTNKSLVKVWHHGRPIFKIRNRKKSSDLANNPLKVDKKPYKKRNTSFHKYISLYQKCTPSLFRAIIHELVVQHELMPFSGRAAGPDRVDAMLMDT